jgi:hypothetical protein
VFGFHSEPSSWHINTFGWVISPYEERARRLGSGVLERYVAGRTDGPSI